MAWLLVPYRKTAEGGRTETFIFSPDGTRLSLVPMDERGKPVDLERRPGTRLAGIVWQKRGHKERQGEDHYWVAGSGAEYLVVEVDVSNGGQRLVRVVQEPLCRTERQEDELLALSGQYAVRAVRGSRF